MPRYLVEVSQPQAVAAKRIDRSVSTLGSHFATHAGWRRDNGRAIGTMVVEADSRSRALGIVPPAMRHDAKVFQIETAAAAPRPHAPHHTASELAALAA
jgi:hypothetical protein